MAPLGLGSALLGMTIDGTPLGLAAAGLLFETAATQVVRATAAVFPLDVDTLVDALPDASFLLVDPCASISDVPILGGLLDLVGAPPPKCGSRLSWLPAVDASVARDELLASLRAGSALDGPQLDALEQARYLVITPCTCTCTLA